MLLATKYLGLSLKNPLVASASPLNSKLDNLRRLEDAGAAAIVLPSLFQEQIESEADGTGSTRGRLCGKLSRSAVLLSRRGKRPLRDASGTLSGPGPSRHRGGRDTHHRQSEWVIPGRLDRIRATYRAGWREGDRAQHVSCPDRSA